MPENARTPLVWGVLLFLLGLPFGAGGMAPLGFVLNGVGTILVAVGVVAWGVWLALDQLERDRGEADASRLRTVAPPGQPDGPDAQ